MRRSRMPMSAVVVPAIHPSTSVSSASWPILPSVAMALCMLDSARSSRTDALRVCGMYCPTSRKYLRKAKLATCAAVAGRLPQPQPSATPTRRRLPSSWAQKRSAMGSPLCWISSPGLPLRMG